ncbi:hypothetical protein NAPIS_ORF02269 [Vairimorpha apis BRL 01]|uniref:Uncharacterized protein n=1 Tax=Vairimorpha apis BRL 01 TaxID=1037528 RepID=T0L651_9MICR|nr:hypothetical protein NAPIS_ORF02269 [Vairimorpha apis BRL 01]
MTKNECKNKTNDNQEKNVEILIYLPPLPLIKVALTSSYQNAQFENLNKKERTVITIADENSLFLDDEPRRSHSQNLTILDFKFMNSLSGMELLLRDYLKEVKLSEWIEIICKKIKCLNLNPRKSCSEAKRILTLQPKHLILHMKKLNDTKETNLFYEYFLDYCSDSEELIVLYTAFLNKLLDEAQKNLQVGLIMETYRNIFLKKVLNVYNCRDKYKMLPHDYMRRHDEYLRCIHLQLCLNYGLSKSKKIRIHSLQEITTDIKHKYDLLTNHLTTFHKQYRNVLNNDYRTQTYVQARVPKMTLESLSMKARRGKYTTDENLESHKCESRPISTCSLPQGNNTFELKKQQDLMDNVKCENIQKIDTMTHMLEISDLSHAYQNSINSQRNATTNFSTNDVNKFKSPSMNIRIITILRKTKKIRDESITSNYLSTWLFGILSRSRIKINTKSSCLGETKHFFKIVRHKLNNEKSVDNCNGCEDDATLLNEILQPCYFSNLLFYRSFKLKLEEYKIIDFEICQRLNKDYTCSEKHKIENSSFEREAINIVENDTKSYLSQITSYINRKY